jgi:hypothetical protein
MLILPALAVQFQALFPATTHGQQRSRRCILTLQAILVSITASRTSNLLQAIATLFGSNSKWRSTDRRFRLDTNGRCVDENPLGYAPRTRQAEATAGAGYAMRTVHRLRRPRCLGAGEADPKGPPETKKALCKQRLFYF